MNSLKVALVIDDNLDKFDGVQQYVLTMGGWLQSQGHEVQYIAGQTTRDIGAPVHSLAPTVEARFNHNRMHIPLPASGKAIRELLQKETYDVIHVQLPCSPWFAGRVVQAASPATAIVGTFHIAPYSPLVRIGSRLLAVYEHSLLAYFHEVISVSPAAKAFARSAFGVSSDILPNAIDLSAYKRLPAPSSDIPTIVFLGRLVERKGCRYLLEAVWRLRQRADCPPFRVVIAGRGPLEQSLRVYVEAHSLTDIVEFRGFIEEADKAALLRSATIAVFPSVGGESFGIVLLEAMAATKGVVLAGDNPGYASVVRPQQLINPKDADRFAAQLFGWLSDKRARQQAYAWQKTAVQRYDVSVVGPRLIGLYERALSSAREMR